MFICKDYGEKILHYLFDMFRIKAMANRERDSVDSQEFVNMGITGNKEFER